MTQQHLEAKSADNSTPAKSPMATPKRSTMGKAAPKSAFSNDLEEEIVSDIWDFDAPQFYDFSKSKTPGPKADNWFNYAHPTPAPRKARKSRLSRLSFISADSRESILPHRLSLSPSRVVAEKNGRLTLDTDSHATKSTDLPPTSVAKENVAFSDTDEEIEFNNWKRDHSLPDDARSTHDKAASGFNRDTLDAHVNQLPGESGVTKELAVDTRQPKKTIERVISRSGAAAGRVTKKQPTTFTAASASVSSKPTTTKPLTIPIEDCGFMRPTRVVSRRLSAKKREKAAKQKVADAIVKSINRRLSRSDTHSLTVPKPFHFHDSRAAPSTDVSTKVSNTDKNRLSKEAHETLIAKLSSKRKSIESNDEHKAFEPSSSSVLKDRAAKQLRPTIPKTPPFAKSKRATRKFGEPATNDGASNGGQPAISTAVKAAKPVPMTLPNHLPWPAKPTVPQPFSFRSDAIAERHLQRLKNDIAQLKEEKEALRQFHAKPLPEFPTPKRYERQQPHVLHTSPFQLQTDLRGEAYQRRLRERLQELEQRQRERREFKAQPIPASIDHPFVPDPPSVSLTAIEEILLRTELRSEERRAYDDDREERERIREEVLARKRLEDERRELEEIKHLRKILVHKPQPIRHYKPLIIKPSERPLTVPKTPQWHIRTRRKSEPAASPPTSPTPASKRARLLDSNAEAVPSAN
ncbi:Protein tpx2 [Coemansia sp. Benny D115]|nr:Protein tpx2 [Coemansia sp. Benny D115]